MSVGANNEQCYAYLVNDNFDLFEGISLRIYKCLNYFFKIAIIFFMVIDITLAPR